jgi:hypothetical protein
MINKKYLPSRKFVIALSVSIAVILFTILFNYLKPNITNFKNNNPLADTNGTPAIANIDLDSDNDGLPDWKENLYGTDPHKADTDGDGTNDVDEITQDRDPLKANTAPAGQEPNDKIDPAIIEENQQAVKEYESLDATDKMARNLMSNIFATQQIGTQIDQPTIDSLVQKSIQDIPVKHYSGITKESDLNLISINEKTFTKDLVVYAKNYITETESFRSIAGKDLEIMNIYASSGQDAKKSMAEITSKYQTIINGLIKTPLPALPGSSGAVAHLAIINDLEKLIQVDNDVVNSNVKDMASIFSDISVYNSTVDELLQLFKVVDIMLKINR